ncbi:MAG: hypothetical protein L6R41_004408 [Letrouitia leprolyta]|nr:MAG: hypothetical protein L6R41_004408 [Letrouitia leprolyta]
MEPTIPGKQRGLVFEKVDKNLAGLHIRSLPVPSPCEGSALVRILGAGVISYQLEIFSGVRDYDLPTPLVGGFSAIGRVVTVGSDAVALEPGMLVFVDCIIRGRDDQDAVILSANSDGFNERSKKLMRDVWRNGTFAEYAKVPLENCIPLDENRLCGELRYSPQDLAYMGYLLVGFGGLRDIKLEAGETIIICPATGGFGGAAVLVAIAMGARVIAMGRNEQELMRLKEQVNESGHGNFVETVKISGDEEKDTATLHGFGSIDAVLDLSPPAAAQSTYLNSAIAALRRKGRASLMGGFPSGPGVEWKVISEDITLKGKFMYEREDVLLMVKMLERGLFPKKQDFVNVKVFGLDEWNSALKIATEYTGIGRFVVIAP